MTNPGKPREFYEAQGEILRRTFTDKRIRISVRDMATALQYKGKSTGATMNAISHLIQLGVIEYDEEKKAYFLT